MKLEKLLMLLPPDILDELAVEAKVDHYSRKLHGRGHLQTTSALAFNANQGSLRTLEPAYESLALQLLNAKYGQQQIHCSFLSERLGRQGRDIEV